MVHLPADRHPSKYQPGVTLMNFVEDKNLEETYAALEI